MVEMGTKERFGMKNEHFFVLSVMVALCKVVEWFERRMASMDVNSRQNNG